MSWGLGNSHRDRKVEGTLSVPGKQNGDLLKQGRAVHLLSPCCAPWVRLQESGRVAARLAETMREGRLWAEGAKTEGAQLMAGQPHTWGHDPGWDREGEDSPSSQEAPEGPGCL